MDYTVIEQAAEKVVNKFTVVDKDIADLDERTETLEQNVTVLEGRVNTFTSLPEGATVGDAELADAKIDKDGTDWSNVGNHIRGVTNQLSGDIDDIKSNNADALERCILHPSLIADEIVTATGTEPKAGYSRTDYIDLCGCKTLHFYDVITTEYRYVLYDASKEFIKSDAMYAGDSVITIPDKAKYIRYSATTPNMESISISLPIIEAINAVARKTIIVDINAEEIEGVIYSSFYKGMNYAFENYCDVKVMPGIYDMYQECIDAEGADYWDDLMTATHNQHGAMIGHGMYVNISPSATIRCHVPYEKWSPNFSPIYVRSGDFTLDGGNFDCSYTRYIVHDDNYSNGAETHIIKNTHMKMDAYSKGSKGYDSCIGAGQNGNTKYIVENNYFEGYIQNISSSSNMLISWHGLPNVVTLDIVQSLFVITGNYLAGYGTIYLSSSSNDNADENSHAYISNNRLGGEIQIVNEHNNLVVHEWNNVVTN